MNWDAVGAIAETAGVLGVVASLVFVGMQVRQNTAQLRQDNLREMIRGTLDTNWYFHRNDEAFDVFRQGCKNFDALPPKDQAHFHSIAVDLSFYLEIVRGMQLAGLIDRAALETNERFFMGILATPGGKQWWDFAQRTKPMPQSAIDYLQSLLEAPGSDYRPITDLQPWFAS